MKVLVTGGAGFLGGAIVKELGNAGHAVSIFGLHAPKDSLPAEYICGDVLEDRDLHKLGEYDVVIHLAGILGTSLTFDDVKKTEITNVIGTLNILEKYKGGGVIIQPNLLGDWLNPYMISKRTAERYGRMYGQEYPVKYISIRPTDIYGPRQSTRHGKAVPTFITRALANEPIPVYGSGQYNMRLIFVEDIAKVIVGVALHADIMPTVIDAGSLQEDNHISVFDLAHLIMVMTGSSSYIENLPMRRGQPKGIVDYTVDLDQSKWLMNTLGVEETPFRVGLQQTIDYYRSIVR